jgi:hypothetical protein
MHERYETVASSAVASLLMALAEERRCSELRMSDMTMTLLIGAVDAFS